MTEPQHIWPKRMKLRTFREVGFAGDPPTIKTLTTLVNKGDIPGEKLGGIYYVWVNENLELVAPEASNGVPSSQGTGTKVGEILERFAQRSGESSLEPRH